jgi:hypothetical protein
VTVKQAREAARQWMVEETSTMRGFRGAYVAGSTNWLSDDADLSATSDVDIMVVLAQPSEARVRHKFLYHGVLLEVSRLRQEQFQSPSQILSDYHLAPSFRTTKFMSDPLGFLAPLLAEVARHYAKRHWVRQRGANARDKLLRFLHSVNSEAAIHDQILACLFAAGITTHILLVAGLKNPTVRTRYQAVRELVTRYGHSEFHETLLNLLGASRISREQAARHLRTLTEVFDAASTAIKSPFPFASDVSDHGRAIAIDGTLELIEQGYHREAMFWVGVTHSRCQKILSLDAPRRLTESVKDSYHELAADLGLSTAPAVSQRCAEIQKLLPQVCNLAETIATANPEVEDRG